jgi:AraC-like DNA-binding protein
MPASRTFSFIDPELYQAAIRASSIELFPTTKGNFNAELTQIELNQLWMQRGSESLSAISQGVLTAKRAVIEFLARQAQPPYQHNGVEVSPGEIVINDWRLVHRRCLTPHNWGSMSLAPAALAAAGRALTGQDLHVPLVTRIVRPAPKLMMRLLGLHEEAGHLAKTAPEVLSHPEVARSLEQALICAMIRCWTEGMSVEPSLRVRSHSAVMARLEEFLVENHDQPAYLAEICAATGVSERTLRVCCQEHLGVGPVRYLWLRRMHLARRALMRADPGAVTVTEVASDYGFGELGRFSVQYRALFGESPSASLHRTANGRRQEENHPLRLRAS